MKKGDTVEIISVPSVLGPSVGMKGYIEELSGDIAYFVELGKGSILGARGSIHISHLQPNVAPWLKASKRALEEARSQHAKECDARTLKYEAGLAHIATNHEISVALLEQIKHELDELDSSIYP